MFPNKKDGRLSGDRHIFIIFFHPISSNCTYSESTDLVSSSPKLCISISSNKVNIHTVFRWMKNSDTSIFISGYLAFIACEAEAGQEDKS